MEAKSKLIPVGLESYEGKGYVKRCTINEQPNMVCLYEDNTPCHKCIFFK